MRLVKLLAELQLRFEGESFLCDWIELDVSADGSVAA